jgi:hypothetical protein
MHWFTRTWDEVVVGDLRLNPLRHHQGADRLRFRQDEGELLPSVPRDDVRGAGASSDQVGDFPQRDVPCGMSESVVELLEIVTSS